MNVVMLVSLLAMLLMIALFAAVRSQRELVSSVEDLQVRWKPVDLPALMNLIDEEEERFLRENLPGIDFKFIHRQRLMVIWEYLSRIGANARLMVQAGQIIQHRSEGEPSQEVRALVADSVRLRNMVFMAKVSTAIKFVLPGRTSPVATVLECYSENRRNLERAFAQRKIHAVTRMA